MRAYFLAGALAASCLGAPACAQQASAWLVNGDISGKIFTVDCKFTPNGAGLGGACTDVSLGGKPTSPTIHPITKGMSAADRIEWTYQSHYLFLAFNVNFSGAVQGNSMSGTVTAGGHAGSFTATRQ